MFKDSYSKYQVFDKLASKRFGACTIKNLVGKNPFDADLQSHLKIRNIVNDLQTVGYFDQPNDVSAEVPNKPDPVPINEGNEYAA